MMKKLGLLGLALAALLTPATALARRHVYIEVEPGYHHHWRHYHHYGYYDRWGYWHPYR